MPGRLIANEEVAEPKTQAKDSAEGSRVGAALASPRGVLLTVPLLVAVVGITLTLVGQRALEQTSLSMARERFADQTSFTGHRIAQALEESGPVLDRLRDVAQHRQSSDSAASVARVLRNLIAGRPGMSQAYIAFPDGTFQGVYLEADGQLHFQEIRAGAGGGAGTARYYAFSSGDLTVEKDEATTYDPRQRAYYRLALEQRKRAWTPPYPFFTTQHTGVTRVEPLFDARGELQSVIAVDFDTSELSSFMARAERQDVHELVFTDDGVILAYPYAKERMKTLKPTDHALNYRDIGDPLLNGFFQPRADEPALADGFMHFAVGGEKMLATVAPIGGATGPGWKVAVLASEQSTLQALKQHRQQSLLVAAAALLAALVAAWFFARHIVRARRAVQVARAKAAEATRKVSELGSYELVTCLGKGGMGEVWRARHRLLARDAAIKLIVTDLTSGPAAAEMNERFKREAQTIASLRSRNTVEIFDYGVTQEGTFFYVMELLDGIDLETLAERYGPQPAARVVQLLLQACNSLAEAHDAGLVHRDIKPANIFICRAADEIDVVKILDFGLVLAKTDESEARARATVPPGQGAASAAVVSARLTKQGSYLGTPAFIAPEQALGAELDQRADLYALGCVAWWLLTGRLLFEHEGSTAVVMAHITEPPPPLRPLVPGPLPELLEEIILRCLRKERDERPASARELGQLLRQIRFGPGEAWTAEHGQDWWRERVSRSQAKAAAMGVMQTEVSHEGARRLWPEPTS